jgi:hypothetical protein
MESDAPMSKTKLRTSSVSDMEIDQAIRRAQTHDRTATKILVARFDQQRDVLVADLSTGATLIIPRNALPVVSNVSADTLGNPTVEAPGYSVWFDRPDVGIRLETLLDVALGPPARDVAARALGASKSARKTAAVRANGVKGGRPRKKT